MSRRSFSLLKLMILYIVELLSLMMSMAKAVWIDLPSSGTKCVSEEIQRNVVVLADYFVIGDVEQHANAVPTISVKDESKLYIFLELVTKGSLMSLYQKYHLQDSQVSAYTRQILHGLKYLHDRNVVHRDIKCANILVDASGSAKLADFGLAKAAKFNDAKSCKGTAFWMAPEVVNRRNQGFGLAADIWSLGCTVLEMLTRQFPYSHLECVSESDFLSVISSYFLSSLSWRKFMLLYVTPSVRN